jgi:hypothetical protein
MGTRLCARIAVDGVRGTFRVEPLPCQWQARQFPRYAPDAYPFEITAKRHG